MVTSLPLSHGSRERHGGAAAGDGCERWLATARQDTEDGAMPAAWHGPAGSGHTLPISTGEGLVGTALLESTVEAARPCRTAAIESIPAFLFWQRRNHFVTRLHARPRAKAARS